ncbi:MAG: hypothetical protein JZU55_12315, partial [Afipia sp.]|nr:hypothetical protein [Afipia sp.]
DCYVPAKAECNGALALTEVFYGASALHVQCEAKLAGLLTVRTSTAFDLPLGISILQQDVAEIHDKVDSPIHAEFGTLVGKNWEVSRTPHEKPIDINAGVFSMLGTPYLPGGQPPKPGVMYQSAARVMASDLSIGPPVAIKYSDYSAASRTTYEHQPVNYDQIVGLGIHDSFFAWRSV